MHLTVLSGVTRLFVATVHQVMPTSCRAAFGQGDKQRGFG